jgi:hypothetical protein
MTDLTTQTLLDRAEISDVFHRYALGVDTRDWGMFRSCFTDDVVADFTSLWPGVVIRGADEWVAVAQSAVNGLDATQHIITNHSHDIQGDTAKCTSYLQAQHVFKNDLGGDQNVIAGYYTYDMLRTTDGWRIKNYSLTVTWTTGNAGIWELAAERLKARAAAE